MDTKLYLSLALGLAFGIVCAFYAPKRGRRSLVWFIIGTLFGILGLLILFLLPSLQEPDVKKVAEPILSPTPQSPPPEQTIFIPNEDESPYTFYEVAKWYYIDAKKTVIGPIPFEDLCKLWKAKEVTVQTYVWTESMQQWALIQQLPLLKDNLVDESF